MKCICSKCSGRSRVARQLKFDGYEFLLCAKCSEQYDEFLADLKVAPAEIQLELVERFMKSELVIRYQDTESLECQEAQNAKRLGTDREFFSIGW